MDSNALYPRKIEPLIELALRDTPVVLPTGPRQADSTAQVWTMASNGGFRYLTLDDELTLFSARADSVDMIRSLDRAVIDEIQHAPQLLLSIKKSVTEDQQAGRFLLTGSGNLMLKPAIADSFAGRMASLLLLPLSQSEIHKQPAHSSDRLFAGHIPQVVTPLRSSDLVVVVLRCVYSEAPSRPTAKRSTS